MPLFSAAINDSPTGSHDIDRRATKKSPSVVCRPEKYTPTAASAIKYAAMMAQSRAENDVCIGVKTYHESAGPSIGLCGTIASVSHDDRPPLCHVHRDRRAPRAG